MLAVASDRGDELVGIDLERSDRQAQIDPHRGPLQPGANSLEATYLDGARIAHPDPQEGIPMHRQLAEPRDGIPRNEPPRRPGRVEATPREGEVTVVRQSHQPEQTDADDEQRADDEDGCLQVVEAGRIVRRQCHEKHAAAERHASDHAGDQHRKSVV